ncbi:OLC1v1030199C1 [Oldenlandia corymbosa var. corymbosa]|uniref:OLC1v1030199C1 n=1 Tax=Oldenlandia corymbosa var. corymbosa TaxID=529605 RepID=A0AAV1CHH7_OLDCO|nr:OLC1v1030199C1 [Oldenlandia corymbosa var. corymbosa]
MMFLMVKPKGKKVKARTTEASVQHEEPEHSDGQSHTREQSKTREQSQSMGQSYFEGHSHSGGKSRTNEQFIPDDAGSIPQIAVAMETMAKTMQQSAANTPRGPLPPHEESEDRALDRFLKFRPPRYSGDEGIEKTEMWLEALDDIFEVLDYSEGRKLIGPKAWLQPKSDIGKDSVEKRKVIEVRKQPTGGSRTFCNYCKKPNHTEAECWSKLKKCLRCGSGDHHIQNCPKLKESTGILQKESNEGGEKPKVAARVFALGHQELDYDTKVVEGTPDDDENQAKNFPIMTGFHQQ